MRKTKLFRSLLAIMLTVVLAVISLPVGVAAAEDGEKWLTYSELVEQKGFVNGIQQCWFINESTGNDWGHSVLDGYKACSFKEETFMRVFYNCKAMGFDIFKTWLNYNHAGMIFDSDYNVIAIDDEYLENLPKVLKMAQDAGLYVCLSTFNHCEGSLTDDNSSYKYEAVTKYIHNENARNMVFENWLRPIIEVTKDFPNVVLIDLYTEPEADAGRWTTGNSTNWDEMREFLKLQNDFVKKINPRLETFSSATIAPERIYESYSGLGLDYYAYDHYATAGGAHETSELFYDLPFIYGECGMNEGIGIKGEDYVSNWLDNYFSESPQYGVKGGFFWRYGYGSSGNHNAIDINGRPRGAMLSSRFFQLDRDYELSGNHPDIDKPVMAYISTSENVVFVGSRGAVAYRVEHSKDLKNWEEAASFNADEAGENEYAPLLFDLKDVNAEEGNTYYYRVIAIGPGGETVISDVSNAVKTKKVYCSDEENLIKNHGFEDENGFNNTGKDGKWLATSQNNSNDNYNMQYITDAVEGDTSYTGTHSISKARKLCQCVTLEPNTNYTFTFHVKFNNKQGYWRWFGGLLCGTPDNSVSYEAYEPAYHVFFDRIQISDSLKTGDWQRMTYSFNSGNNTDVKVEIQCYHDKEDNAEWYVDDFYLFKSGEQ